MRLLAAILLGAVILGGQAIPIGSGGAVSIPDPLFSLLGDEGTGNPDWGGTESSGTCDFTDLGWDAGPPVAMSGNNSSTIGTCGTGLDSSGLANFTVTGCISPLSFGVNGSTRIIHKGDATTESWSILLVDSTATIRGSVFDQGGGGTNRFFEASITVNDGWKHFAAVFEDCGSPITNCDGEIYINGGDASASPGGTGAGNRFSDDAFVVRIFNHGQANRTYDGLANKLAVYSGALSAGQVAAISSAANCGN